MAAVMEVMGSVPGLGKNKCKAYETMRQHGVPRLSVWNPIKNLL